MHRRINVSSGRPLESRAHYSRALRAGQVVFQSGTTAIDRDGNVLGDTVAAQVEAILDIAAESMAAAEGSFEDVVRARLYVKGGDNIASAVAAFGRAFSAINPAVTVIPIRALARPAQLIEIELEAIDGARTAAVHVNGKRAGEVDFGGSAAVRIADRIFIGALAPQAASAGERMRQALGTVVELLDSLASNAEDLVALKIFTPDLADKSALFSAFERSCPRVKPVVTLIGVPEVAPMNAGLIIEAEAVAGAAAKRRDIAHPQFKMFSAAVAADEQIFVSNLTAGHNDAAGAVPDDWGGQCDRSLENLSGLLQDLGACLDDVVVRRYFTRADSEMSRDYGEGPPWFEDSRPAALGCRIKAHADPDVLISVESHAIRGAGQDIEWRTLPVST